MAAMEAFRVINGTFGEVWINDRKVAECKGLQAKLEPEKEDINIAGQLMGDTKMVGMKGKGSLKLHKINSRMVKLLLTEWMKGRDVRCTIITKLADPDALGVERVALAGVAFDDLTLADWEVKKAGEQECPFTFSKVTMLETIPD